jgi:hypothetical protein
MSGRGAGGAADALKLRPCAPADVPAVLALFDAYLVHAPGPASLGAADNLAACVKAAAAEGADGFLPGEGRVACVLAHAGGQLIGAVVTALWKLLEATEARRIPFQLLKAPPAAAEVVVVKAIAVAPLQRRRAVGTELLRAGISHLAMENARCAAVRGFVKGRGVCAAS